MKKHIVLLVVLILFSNISLFAQDNSEKNEQSNFKLTFSERFRVVTWDNAITLSEASNVSQTFSRIRTSAMGQWFPNKQIEVGLKLTNEFRSYFFPTNKDFDLNEIFIDQLYAKYKNDFGTITLGRQNIILGEGFVVMDGHPLDGSRSIYFNAARFDWNIDETKGLTLFATYQPETDNILPVINDYDQALIEQPETGIGAYFTAKLDKVNLQTYYVYKKVDDTDAIAIKSNIHTAGARVSLPLSEQFTLTGEGAYQFGDCADFDRAAFGGYAYVNYSTGLKEAYLPKTISVGGIYLSGDDPSTQDVEAWDPVFSRWPKWSESYIYTQIIENGGKVAYWTNFASIYAKLKFDFTGQLNFGLDYHHMLAVEDAPAATFPGGTGSTRGDLLIAKLGFNINENLGGHILWEHFEPGDFYFDGADGYNWARIEFLLKI